jgi:hypothetical protein
MYKLEMRWDIESPWVETQSGDGRATDRWDNAEDAYHAFVSTVEKWPTLAHRMVECHSDGTRLAVVAILDLGRLEVGR